MSATETPVDMATLNQCVSQASKVHDIHPVIIKSLIAVEGGRIGTNKMNKNRTMDMGVMQINTINYPEIKRQFGYTMQDLIIDPCKNIMAGTWLLWQRIQESPKKIWVAVGNYHSKTPWYRHNYLKNVEKAYSAILPVYGKPEEAKAIGRTTNWGQADQRQQTPGQFQFPSLRELELLVAQGGDQGAMARPTNRHSRASISRSQPVREVVAINNKRKVLRFID